MITSSYLAPIILSLGIFLILSAISKANLHLFSRIPHINHFYDLQLGIRTDVLKTMGHMNFNSIKTRSKSS